jgi:hypothetical protein
LKLLITLIIFPFFLFAHQSSFSYLNFDFNKTKPVLKWEIGVLLLEKAINLDEDKNKKVTIYELTQNKKKIIKYIQEHFKLKLNNQLFTLNIKNFEIEQHKHDRYIIIDIPLKMEVKNIDIDYNLFFDIDPLYRCFVTIQDIKNKSLNTLFSVNKHINIDIEGHKTDLIKNLKEFFIEGIWHIWLGIDHILFLLMLIIPSVKYIDKFKPLFFEILKIVTAFSIAHSITLILSALGILFIPSQFIEVTIAISVLLTAFNNIFEKIKGLSWQIAFGFGLIHGFGFANALTELELPQDIYIYLLFIFNLGIEFGQLMIVTIVLPLLFILRKSKIYSIWILKIGSLLTIFISIIWISERL